MRFSIRQNCFLVTLAAALIWPGGSALAFEVHCIEASKYKYIWKLFGDDKQKFAEFFQVGKDRLPEPEMCRAVILTGTIGDLKWVLVDERLMQHELAKLVEVIRRNKGWLAEIYLASPGGLGHLAMLLGELVRTSWLKTKALDEGVKAYSPDIVSVSPSNAARSAYEAATKGLTRIKVPGRQKLCGSACSAIHVAGVERQGAFYVHRPKGGPGPKPKARTEEHLITTAEHTELFIAYLQRMDAGSDVVRKTAKTPTTSVARVQSSKYPNEIRNLARECGFDEVLKNEEGRVTPPAIQAQRAKAESCLAGQIERGRLERFGKACPESRCDIEAIYITTRFSLFLGIAETGNAVAQAEVGAMFANGQSVPQDFAEAAKWYRKAAEQGDDGAQFILGVMFSNGQGVPQDYAEAVKWYRKAAEQGLAAAQFNLGVMFANGQGVPQDYSEAVKWYRKAAEQGDADAQNNLGVMFTNGQGVPQNFAEAVKWYRKAADQGETAAQNNLGHMYEYGIGVTTDKTEALKWYLLAANDEQQRASALRRREHLVSTMTSGEIEEAERRARAWTASHKKQ